MRLSRIGKHKRPFYRIVVADGRFPRDGRFLEVVGTYDPLAKQGALRVNSERLNGWLKKGAQATDTVKDLLRRLKNVPAPS
ncbi:MAG: 30S ribosomal protein S16 [Nitrospira sp.]|nr:30S ribosomal protein S16 [Nitrospira sp.]